MAVTSFKDLPLADRGRRWDSDAADKRLRKWAGVTDEPNAKYRSAFVWYDAAKKDELTAYKLPIADVIGGALKVVPRAVMAAAAVVQGSRGGVDVPQREMARVKAHLAKYYAKMGEEPPWKRTR